MLNITPVTIEKIGIGAVELGETIEEALKIVMQQDIVILKESRRKDE